MRREFASTVARNARTVASSSRTTVSRATVSWVTARAGGGTGDELRRTRGVEVDGTGCILSGRLPVVTADRWTTIVPVPISPMLPTAAAELPVGEAWSYEAKWDGYRTLIEKHGDRVVLWSRNAKNVTQQYPGIAAAARALPGSRLVLDGEVVALDADGRPSFQALQHRATTGLALVYYAFDLLRVDDRDLLRRPLDERRVLLANVPLQAPLLRSDPLPGTPSDIVQAVRRVGLEGIVAKRRGSVYIPGKRTESWVKVRFAKRQEFVVGGFKPSGATFDSVLVGYYEGRTLRFAGKVRAGFTPHSRAEVWKRISALGALRCPFANLPNSVGRTSHWGEGITEDEMTKLRWVKPRVVIEVGFTEWTRDGNLRHASFAGMRDDKAARDVQRA